MQSMSAILYTVRIDDQTYEAQVTVPESPRCTRCGHELCPCCEDWCDELECECDGECTFNADERDTWLAEIARRRTLACFGGSGYMFEL